MTKRFRAATSLVLFLTFVGLCWGNEQTISYPHNSIQLNSKFPVRIFFQSSENQKIPQISFASSREFQVFVDDETVSISDPEFSSSSGADQLQFFFPLTAFACALAFFGNKKHALFIAITILFVRANSQNANEIVITVTSPNGWVYTELFVESPDITGVDIGDAQVQQMDFNLCFTSGTKVELYQTTLPSIRICADTVVLSDISFIDGASVEIEATDSIYLHTRDVFAGSFTIDSDDLEIIYDTRVCDVSVGSQVTSGTCEGGSTRVSLVGGSVDVDFGLLPPSRSSTPTISVSQSNTRTVSITPTTSHTPRPSRTPSETSSPSSSTSTSPTPSITSSASNSPSASASASNTPSASAIPSTSSSTSPSLSESATISASASVTPSPVLPGSPGNPIDVSEFVPVDNNYYSQSITETETYFTFTSAIDAIVLYSTCTLGDPDTDIVLYLDTPNEVTIDNGCGDNSVTARAYHAVRTGHIQLFKVVNPTNASVDFSFGGYDANIVGSSCADPVPLQPNGIEDYVYVTEVAAFETLYFSNTFIGPIDNDNRDFDTCRSSLGSTSVNVYDTDGIDLVCDTPSDSFTDGCINNSNLAGFVIDGTHSVYEVTNDSPVGGVLVAEQEVTPGGTCFSGTTLVTERTRGVIPMSEVSVGDFVLSGNQEWTEVIAWSHRHTSGIYEFVELSFGEDKSLLMTAEHLIFILEQNGNVKSIPAMKVQVGDVLLTSVGEQVIVRNISRKLEKGIYAPLTTSGDIEVDGVLASCFIHPMSHSWWQVVSYPFRITPSWVLSMIWDPNIDQREMHGMSALVLAGATISHHITHLW